MIILKTGFYLCELLSIVFCIRTVELFALLKDSKTVIGCFKKQQIIISSIANFKHNYV